MKNSIKFSAFLLTLICFFCSTNLQAQLHTVGLQSQNTNRPVSLEIYNNAYYPVNVYSINSDGQEVHYARLSSGQSLKQQTVVAHPWIIRKAKNSKLIRRYDTSYEQAQYLTVKEVYRTNNNVYYPNNYYSGRSCH